LLAAVAFVSACERDVGTVNVFLVKSPRADQDPLDPFVVARIRLRLTGPDEEVRSAEFEFAPGGSGRLADVPAGDGWVLSVEAIDASGNPRSRGRSLPFSVSAGARQVVVWIGRVGRFSLAHGSLRAARAGHSATPLPDGRILVAGGTPRLDRTAGPVEPDGALPTAEIVDPGAADLAAAAETGCSSSSDALCLRGARAFHGASLLEGGEVLLTGGENGAEALATTEIYRPDSQRLFAGPMLAVARAQHVALALAGGPLLAGGRSAPATALREVEWLRDDTFLGLDPLSRARHGAAGVVVEAGGLVTGGLDGEGGVVDGPAEVFEPGASRFLQAAAPVVPRAHHAAAALDDGRVLLLGGLTAAPCVPGPGCVRPATASIEAFDVDRSEFSEIGSLLVARWGHTATVLPDGTVLVVGGFGGGEFGEPVPQVEVVDPSSGTSRMWTTLTEARAFHTTLLADNGFVYVAGGAGAGGDALSSIEVGVP
jgi:hypothetical protein